MGLGNRALKDQERRENMRLRVGPLAPQECATDEVRFIRAPLGANLGGTTWIDPAPQGRGVFAFDTEEVVEMTERETDRPVAPCGGTIRSLIYAAAGNNH